MSDAMTGARGEAELLRDLGRVFRRAGPGGRRAYAERDVRALLFVLFLRMSSEGRAAAIAAPEVAELVGEMGIRIGLDPSSSPEVLGRAIEDYFRRHPIDVALREEVEALLREHASGAYARRSIDALRRLTGAHVAPSIKAPPNGKRKRQLLGA